MGENMKLFLLPCLLAVFHLTALEAAPMEETVSGNLERSAMDYWRECRQDEFKCRRDGRCIPLLYRCDGRDHCSDGHDEEGCSDTDCGRQFRCRTYEYRQCIGSELHCDGKEDCGDGSDEWTCSMTTTTTPRPCYKNCLVCPQPYELHGSACFYWRPEREVMSWNEAAQQCREQSGGMLPVFHSPEIKQYVTEKFGKSFRYIGLTDKAEESKWKWEDGTEYTMNKSEWSSGEPNNDAGGEGEDCAEFKWGGDQYNDIGCNYKNDFHPLLCMIIPKRTDPECRDRHWDKHRCKEVLEEGDCHRWVGKDYCYKTCGFCGLPCVNQRDDEWCSKRILMCNRQGEEGREGPEVVSESCEKTCNLCG